MHSLVKWGLIGFGALVVLEVVVSNDRTVNGSDASSSSDTSTQDRCDPSRFTVSNAQAYADHGYAHLTGIVRHDCVVAAGIRLKWTAFNADHTIAFSEDFWPASTTNIPPNTDYPFEMMNTAPRGSWTYTVVPVSVSYW